MECAINRLKIFEQTATCIERLRRAGVGRPDFDLIYGLPLQTVESCLETVAKCIELRPDRLSVFGYAHIPSFEKHQCKIATDVCAAIHFDAHQRGRLLVLRRPRGMCATALDVWPMYEGKSERPYELRRGPLASKTATVANATAFVTIYPLRWCCLECAPI
ncbi:hypothetical protein ACVWXO_000502 [Bradyrhizobium sp. LM2.7]